MMNIGITTFNAETLVTVIMSGVSKISKNKTGS